MVEKQHLLLFLCNRVSLSLFLCLPTLHRPFIIHRCLIELFTRVRSWDGGDRRCCVAVRFLDANCGRKPPMCYGVLDTYILRNTCARVCVRGCKPPKPPQHGIDAQKWVGRAWLFFFFPRSNAGDDHARGNCRRWRRTKVEGNTEYSLDACVVLWTRQPPLAGVHSRQFQVPNLAPESHSRLQDIFRRGLACSFPPYFWLFFFFSHSIVPVLISVCVFFPVELA